MSAVAPDSMRVEVELSGVGGGWTDISADIIGEVRGRYGIPGSSPTDRVATTGTLAFVIDNSEANSAATLGYYTPGHSACRAGWALGIGVRFVVVYGEQPYYKWRGVIDGAAPEPTSKKRRRVRVTCVDWMDEAARATLSGIPVQINKRSDQIFSTIVSNVVRQPAALEIGYGMESYPYALDGALDEGGSVLSEIKRCCDSELGFAYIKGDTTQGGTLVFEDRRKRGALSTSKASFSELTANQIPVARGTRDAIINHVKVRIRPRRVDPIGDDPSTIAGLRLWLRGDGLVGYSDGDAVATWPDSSGNGYDAVAAGAARPTFDSSAIGGMPGLRFDGATDVMTSTVLSNLIAANAGTIFVVATHLAGASGGVAGDQTNSYVSLRMLTTGTIARAVNHDGGFDTADKTVVSGTPYCLTWMHGGGNVYSGANDTRTASLEPTASGNTTALTGTFGIGQIAGTFLDGYICEVLVYNVALAEVDRQTVEAYLGAQYGLDIAYDIGGAAVTLFTLETVPYIPRGTSITIHTPYRDPDQKGSRVGGVGMLAPVATTDYTFNTAESGGGTDATVQLVVTPTFGGNSAALVISNPGPLDGYLTWLRVRGLGVYDDEEIVLEASDAASQALYGKRSLPWEMPYQSDVAVAQDAAYYLLAQSREDCLTPTGMRFLANESDTLMRAALLLEISDRIDIAEADTEIDGSFFINEVAFETRGQLLWFTWKLAPADTEAYWKVGDAELSQLDSTTRIAYGLWNRFWLLGVSPMGVDTRLSS